MATETQSDEVCLSTQNFCGNTTRMRPTSVTFAHDETLNVQVTCSQVCSAQMSAGAGWYDLEPRQGTSLFSTRNPSFEALPSLTGHHVRGFRAASLLFVVMTTTEGMRAKKLIALGVGEGSPSRCSALGNGWGLKCRGKVANIMFPNIVFEGVRSLRYCLRMNMIIFASSWTMDEVNPPVRPHFFEETPSKKWGSANTLTRP